MSQKEQPTAAQDIKSGIERFRLGDRPDVSVLYPDVCFASLEAVGDMPVSLLVESVLAGWHPESHLTAPDGRQARAPFPVASLVVSRDGQTQFHPELSNREPVEIQVWADRRVTLEVEFQGLDVSTVPHEWASTARRVLDAWATTFGLTLLSVYNDRARSLPDVWNATFEVAVRDLLVADLVGLGERALRTAELSMTGWGGEEDVRRLLQGGDTHSVLGWQPSAILEFWPGPPDEDQVELLAADICALANSVRGGTVVFGVDVGAGGARLDPFPAGDYAEVVAAVLRERLYPVPERALVRHLPARGLDDAGGPGILVLRIPPQDRLLWPFLVQGRANAGDGNLYQHLTLVEREGAETIARSAAAVHAALAAGIALLRGVKGHDED